jgi:5-carboxymethyl-2-hydroxymuconate isomerase
MPHFYLEYTDNIKAEARIPELLRKVAKVIANQNGAFQVGGIRVRAIELKEYVVADGQEDDAYVHATFKIARGRSQEVIKKACDELFETMKEHFAELYAKRYFALSLDYADFGEMGTYKHNNIHSRFKKT